MSHSCYWSYINKQNIFLILSWWTLEIYASLGVMHFTFTVQRSCNERKWDGFPGHSLNPTPFCVEVLITTKVTYPRHLVTWNESLYIHSYLWLIFWCKILCGTCSNCTRYLHRIFSHCVCSFYSFQTLLKFIHLHALDLLDLRNLIHVHAL
jgi:hypothetical protein